MKGMKTTRSTVLMLALSALAIGLVIVLGVRLDQATGEEIVARFSQRQLLLAEQTAAGIQSIFDEARRDLLHIIGGGGQVCLADALGAENEEGIATCRGVTEQGLSSYLRSHPNYTQIRYIDGSGQEIAGVDVENEAVRIIPQDQLRSQAEREFFVATKQLDEKEIHVSPLEPALGHGGMRTGHWTVRLATPVFDSQGRRAGIVVLNLLGDEIRAHVARLSAEEGANAWVLDGTGIEFINATHPEREGSNTYKYCQQTGDETLVALVEDMLAGNRGTATYLWPESAGGPPAVQRLAAYAPVYPAEGQVWSVGASEPYGTVLAAHRQTHRTLLLLGEGIITIVLAGAVLATRSGYKRAIAEEQARLSEVQRRRGDELEALQEISLAISAQLGLDELLQNVVEQGCRLLEAKGGGIYLVDETRGDLQLIANYGYARDYTGARLAPGEGLAGRVLQSGEPLTVDDYCHWEGRSPDWEAKPLTAVLGVPLKRGEQVTGVLEYARSGRAREFTEHDTWLATLFANQAAVAVENARLYQAEQRGRDVAEALQETARAVNASLNLDKVLPLILEQLAQVTEYDSCAVSLLDDGRFKVTAGRGFPDLEAALRLSFSADEVNLSSAVTHARRPLVIADAQADTRWQPDPRVTHIRGWIGAPLIVRDKAIGVLTVDSRQPGVYSEEDGQLVFAFANQAAVAIENARLFEAEREQRAQAEALREAGIIISSALDPDEVLERLLEQVERIISSDSSNVMLIENEKARIAHQRGYERFDAADEVARVTFEVQETDNLRQMIETGQPYIVPDTTADPDWVVVETTAYIRSWAGAPITVGGEVAGFFCLDKTKAGFYQQQHAELLAAFARQAGVAIENARLYQQAQREIAERRQAEEALKRRATQLATVGEVGRQITSLLEPDPLLDRIVNLIREAFGYYYVSILLVDPATGGLAFRAGAGYEVEIVKALRLKVGQDGICGWVAASGEPLLVGDVSQEPRYYPVESLADTRSELAVPIQVKSQVIGVLDVQSAEPEAFDKDDLFTLHMLADQVAVALENTRLFEREREQRELAEALEEAAAAVSSTLDPDHVLDRILEQVERVVAGDTFNVMLLEDGTARIVRWRGYERIGVELLNTSFIIARYPSLVKMAQTGEPVVIPDTAADPDWMPMESQEWRRSYVGAPIRVKDLVVGFLNVAGTRPGQFGLADGRWLEAFAAHAATAIENAQLYRELLDHAGQLEQRVRERTAQLQAQYARLDAILRSTTDGIVVADAEGEIVQANPVAQAWLTQTLSPQDAARLRETLRYLTRQAGAEAADGERPEMMLELTGLDLELKIAPISEPEIEEALRQAGPATASTRGGERSQRAQGKPAVVAVVHDVSHLKALDRMKNRFVTNISHELRTPVTTIKLYAYLMQQQPEKWREYLKPLAQEADHQAQLVGDILQISHIDAGRLEIKPRPTSLDELTQAAVASHQVLAQERGLTLEYRPFPTPSPSWGEGRGEGPVSLVDPERMKQVLNNLVENGIYYTPEGGTVVVSTSKEKAEGRVWATVTVADTGIGIPAEELPYIFDRFFRGVEPRSMQISGTGLGLAIVREIVELHGGRVTMESQAGAGTTFTTWLPLVEGQA